MSKPIDINKATLEKMTSITGIGEKRAQKILSKKQEKESDLTLQDLKLMTGIPSTIWDPLTETREIMIRWTDTLSPTYRPECDSENGEHHRYIDN